jgi:hypothetical protein
MNKNIIFVIILCIISIILSTVGGYYYIHSNPTIPNPLNNFTERTNTILDYWDVPYKTDLNKTLNDCSQTCTDDSNCKAFMRIYPGAKLLVKSGTYISDECAYLDKLKNPNINNNSIGSGSLYIKNN